jgi:hypothetical protein
MALLLVLWLQLYQSYTAPFNSSSAKLSEAV